MTWTRRGRGWAARSAAGLLTALALVLLLPASPAAAHARLVSSTPTEAAVLAQPPAEVVLVFDEPVRSVSEGFRLYDRAGSAVVLSSRVTDRTATAALPGGLHEGSYVLSWRVVSSDSHPVNGALTFVVGRPDGTAPQVVGAAADASVGTTYSVLTGLGYLALMILVGLSVFEVLMLRDVTDDGRARRRLLAVAALSAPVVYALLVPVGTVRESGGPLADLLRTSSLTSGWRSPAGLALLLVVTGSVLLATARQAQDVRSRTRLTVVGSILAIAAVLPVGHTRSHGPAWLVLSTDAAHAGAAAVWFGGLIGLSLFLARARRTALDPREAAAVLGRFSAAAGAVVVVLALSGTGLAVVMLGSARVLLSTTYGHVLLVKVALAAVVGGLAVWNRAVLLPRLGDLDTHPAQWERLARAVRAEVVVLVLVVAATSVLGMQDPGPGLGGGGAGSAGAATVLAADLGTGHLNASLTPGRPGVNVVTFQVVDAADQPVTPVAVPEVTVAEPELSLGPLKATVAPGEGPGSYRATVNIPAPGRWRINAAVRVSEFEQPSAVADVTIAG